MERMKRFLERFLVGLSGGRADILARLPRSELRRFVVIGVMSLLGGATAAAAMAALLHDGLGWALWAVLTAASVWGVLLLSLNRWIIVLSRSSRRRPWGPVIPFFLLCVLTSLTVSEPVALQVFRSQVTAQVSVIQRERAAAYTAALDADPVTTEINRLSSRVEELREVVRTGGGASLSPAEDPLAQTLTSELAALRRDATDAYEKWQCQLYGGQGCLSGVKGDGVLARAAMERFKRASAQVASAQNRLDERIRQLKATGEQARKQRLELARAQLPTAQAQLDAARARRLRLQQTFEAANRSDTGLLTRLTALRRVRDASPYAVLVEVLIALLVMLAESFPVLIGLSGRRGPYEEAVARADREALRAAMSVFSSGLVLSDGNIWDIWAGTGAKNATGTDGAGTPAGDPLLTAVPSRPAGDAPGSPAGVALREMPDTRIRFGAGLPGASDLFPDDE
ncbi:DUF4407 domain-containing protein [Streptosporangium sp. NPDC051023]|uniref:DUF4407 domain-containing protein n=1 Tax=Streptosporangium sp. NPDC051023 TaxID=3155410 RepID=UPI00344F4CFD